MTDPGTVFLILAVIVGAVYFLSEQPLLAGFFKYVPPVVLVFFIPTVIASFGALPHANPAYDVLSAYALPLGLTLLTLSVDVKALLRLGPKALWIMAASVGGVMAGAVLSYIVFAGFLPPDAWQGMTALTATWTGGSVNLVAWQQGLNASPSIIGPILVVDTIVGYGWLAIVIALVPFSAVINKRLNADSDMISSLQSAGDATTTQEKPAKTGDLVMMLGLAASITLLAQAVAPYLPEIGDPPVISPKIWVIMLCATAGLCFSATPVRQLEAVGASKIGYVFLLLLMASVGAKADLSSIFSTPIYMAAGLLMMSVHILIIFLVARLLHVPLALTATASIASIGGAVSGPIAAAAYAKHLAPMGVMLGLAGYVAGIYAPAVVAFILSALAAGA